MEQDISYSIVKGVADNNELEKYRLCFENNGSPRDIRNLQWLHQQNFAGLNSIYYALSSEDVAAIYTAMPVVFAVNGQEVNALQSIDTMTDKNHRGKGLFPKLANRLYAKAEEEGYELVYGFPNENSAPGFFKKLQWVSFGEAPFLFKPLRLWYFLNKILKKNVEPTIVDEKHGYTIAAATVVNKNVTIKEISKFDSEYDLVWEKACKSVKVGINRSATYMNWRYVHKPGEQYSRCGIYIDGALKGVIVFTIKNKHNGRIGYIMELIYDDSSKYDLGNLMLRYATKIFRKENVDVILAWSFAHSFNYKSYRKAGYYNLPEKFRPQHLFLGVRVFNEKNRELIKDKMNWYISYSDSDTV